MANITIQVDEAQKRDIDTMLAALPGKIASAEAGALNNSMKHGKAVAADDLAKELTARRSDVAKRLNIVKADKDHLSVVMYIRGGIGVNLIAFSPKKTAKGVSVKIFGSRQVIPHAFITRGIGKDSGFRLGATGAKFVAMREGAKRAMTKGEYAGRKILRGPRAGQPLLRQPLAAQRGPTVAEVWESTPGLAERTVSETQAAIPKNVANQIDRFLKE